MSNASKTGNGLQVQFMENGMGMVRDCDSGEASRMLNCVLSIVVGSLSAVLMPLLMLVGFVGNLLVAHVMLARLRPLTRQNLYLGCIAIADLLSLAFNGTFNGLLNKGLPWLTRGRMSFMLYNVSDAGCKVTRGITNFLYTLTSLWLLVLVSDRVLVVLRPLAMKQVGRHWAVGALLVSLSIAALLSVPSFLLNGHQYILLPGVKLIYCYMLPQSSKFTLPFTLTTSNPPTAFILIILALDLVLLYKVAAILRTRSSLTLGQSQNAGADTSGTIVVLILGCAYLALNTPLLILRPMLEVALSTLDILQNLNYLTVLANLTYASMSVTLLNQCVSFFVLLTRSASFKRAVVNLIHCRPRDGSRRNWASSYGTSELRPSRPGDVSMATLPSRSQGRQPSTPGPEQNLGAIANE